MTTKPKPHIHGRDHEHGGADPTLIHWEDVGTSGAGGGGIQFDVTPQEGGFLKITTVDGDGYILIENGGSAGFFIRNNSTDAALNINSAQNLNLFADGGIQIIADTGLELAGDPVTINLSGLHNLVILDLPTSPPASPNCVWNDGGTLKIT